MPRSQPSRPARSDTASKISAMRSSAPQATAIAAASGRRTRARTRWPRATSRGTRWRPYTPVAPRTAIDDVMAAKDCGSAEASLGRGLRTRAPREQLEPAGRLGEPRVDPQRPPPRVCREVGPSHPEMGRAEVAVRPRVVWIEADGGQVLALRAGDVAPAEADVAEVVVGRGGGRVEAERGLERRLGLLRVAEREQRERPIVVRGHQTRSERERPIERGERLGIPLLLPVETAEVIQRHRPRR